MATEEQVGASKKLKTQLYLDSHTKRKLKISISFPTQRKEIRKTMTRPTCMFLLHTLKNLKRPKTLPNSGWYDDKFGSNSES